MEAGLALLDQALDLIAACDEGASSDSMLRASVTRMQRQIDRLKIAHARVLHEAERRRLADGSGHRDVADMVAAETQSSRAEARSRQRLGAALGASPELLEAAESGDVSAATAETLFAAVTDVPDSADAADVAGLIEACRGAGPRDAADAVDVWKASFRSESPDDMSARRYAKRSLRTVRLDDGMGQLTFIAPILDLRQVTNAISHVAGKPCESDGRSTEQRMADGLIQLAVAHSKGEVRGGRENPNLLLTMTADAYVGASDGDAVTAHGDRVPAHTARFLTEQADIQRVMLAGGQVLDLGREVRFASHGQYKALVVRDGGCRWPGCTIPAAWCDIDHIRPWEQGGSSDLDNLIMWCRHHHTVKHAPGVTASGDVNRLRIHLADGTIVQTRPPRLSRAA